MVLGGGVALGAYQAGAYERLHEQGVLVDWLAAGSVGAVNAALIAGNPQDRQVERLRSFWDRASTPSAPLPERGLWRLAHNWGSVLRTRLTGQQGLFRPRLSAMLERFPSLYDLSPLRDRLEGMVDFDRLNGGDVRVTIATTDIITGEQVIFDTARGDRIRPDHVLASCGFLPDFPPLEIGGRILGDAALSANVPLDPVLAEKTASRDLVCFVLDLFTREGGEPRSLETAAARRLDLILGNQTRHSLAAHMRISELQAGIARLAQRLPAALRHDPEIAALLKEGNAQSGLVLFLSYEPPPDEAGPERQFDYSSLAIVERWKSGKHDMEQALRVMNAALPRQNGLTAHMIQHSPTERV